jgi:endonuclease G, mitochondrial
LQDSGPRLIEKKQNFDENYATREGKGYDENFLGVEIPLPRAPTRRGELLNNSDGTEFVLDYYHFSLVMNKDRRLMMWSASNTNYGATFRDSRERDDFGGENWREDPRIAEKFGSSYQITKDDFYGPATRIDQGHVVRRGDNCWGSSRDLIEWANADTYHYTNCTPQHEAFNREIPARTNDPKKRAEYAGRRGLWGWFEAFVQERLEKIEDSKASLFAGPILSPNDPRPREGQAEIRGIQYPLRFWKVVALVASPGSAAGNVEPQLLVYGYIFDQSDVIGKYGLGIKEAKAEDFRIYQVTLSQITSDSGVEFAKALHDHDVFAKSGGGVTSKRIRTEEDIVLA